MIAKTASERKAAERQRQKDAGLKRIELYARPADHTGIKAYAAKLATKRAKGTKCP